MKYKKIFTSKLAWVVIAIWGIFSMYTKNVNYSYGGYDLIYGPLTTIEYIAVLIGSTFSYFFLASIFWIVYHWKKKED